jgi:hypothetical protein
MAKRPLSCRPRRPRGRAPRSLVVVGGLALALAVLAPVANALVPQELLPDAEQPVQVAAAEPLELDPAEQGFLDDEAERLALEAAPSLAPHDEEAYGARLDAHERGLAEEQAQEGSAGPGGPLGGGSGDPCGPGGQPGHCPSKPPEHIAPTAASETEACDIASQAYPDCLPGGALPEPEDKVEPELPTTTPAPANVPSGGPARQPGGPPAAQAPPPTDVWTVEIARRHDAEAAAARALAEAKARQAKLEEQAGVTAEELEAQPALEPNDAGFTLAGPGGLDRAKVAKAAGITQARLRGLQLAANLTDEARAAKALAEANRTGDPSDVKGAEYRLGRVRFLGLALAIADTPSDEPDPRRTTDGHRADEDDIKGVPHVSIGPLIDGLTEPGALKGFTPAEAAEIGAALGMFQGVPQTPVPPSGAAPVPGAIAGAIVGAVLAGDDCAAIPAAVPVETIGQAYTHANDAALTWSRALDAAIAKKHELDALVAERDVPGQSRVERNDLEFTIREATNAVTAARQESARLEALYDEASEASQAAVAAAGLPAGVSIYPCLNQLNGWDTDDEPESQHDEPESLSP